jgi:hypothetical protein
MAPSLLVCVLVAGPTASAPSPRPAKPAALTDVKPLSPADAVKVLQTIDGSMYCPGVDYKAVVYMEQKQKGQADRVFELFVFRRDKDHALLLLFTKPKTEAGVGYLRIGKNMWYYAPSTGKWERHTVHDRLVGTDALSGDFDKWTLATDYNPEYESAERLGDFVAYKLKLMAKPDIEVAHPVTMLWVDTKTGVPLKIQGLAQSGRLLSTQYLPQWVALESAKDNKTVSYPKEIIIYNEVNKGSQTLIKVQQAELGGLPENVFTKAWLESQSR